jgi:hypothetical protein
VNETQQFATVPAGGRGTKALRVTTHALRLVGDYVGAVASWTATAAVVLWMANDVIEFASALSKVTAGEAILLILAVAGTATLIETIAYGTADWIDPDARDGDALWDVVKELKQLTADVRQGADYDDIMLGVQASKVLPAMSLLLGALGDAYEEDGEREEARALYEAGISLRYAARELGEKDALTA